MNIFASKESGIAAIIELGKERDNRKNWYLKRCKYKDSEEYRIVEESDVLDYSPDNYVGKYNYFTKQWIPFDIGDRINTPQTEMKKKDMLVFPTLQSERAGFVE